MNKILEHKNPHSIPIAKNTIVSALNKLTAKLNDARRLAENATHKKALSHADYDQIYQVLDEIDDIFFDLINAVDRSRSTN